MNARIRTIVLLVAVSCAAACGGLRRSTPAPGPVVADIPSPASAAPSAPSAMPVLYERLGSWKRPISTRSAAAQAAFDQALTLTFAFNHDEAIRLYEEAARLDPACAMPWWGIAFANGPHINNATLPPERAKAAWAALERARSLASGASPVERDLIDALGHRYAADPDAPRPPLDQAFADAMRRCWRAHPDDADVGVLCAEALMDLQPWDLWTIDGKPKGNTQEIVAILEAVLARWPGHPGANHLYIHAIEASPEPAKGVAAADRLGGLVPDAGHLVHMPAHIYIRVGRYADASRSNELAMEADRRNEARFPKAGFYRVYMTHNPHFLTFASMMEGRREAALAAAAAVTSRMPPEFVRESAPLVDGFFPTKLHVLVRFGEWDAILAEPPFDPELRVAGAVRHYARGIALAALGRVGEAKEEQAALDAAYARIEEDRPIGNNPARTVLRVPQKMLAAEIAFREGRHDASFAAFREAIAVEDALVYDEPPDWMQPVRHAFAASLLAADRLDEAEKILREDLVRFPENGWSLTGLIRCLRARGAMDEARAAAAILERTWARADVAIDTPCLCQPGAAK